MSVVQRAMRSIKGFPADLDVPPKSNRVILLSFCRSTGWFYHLASSRFILSSHQFYVAAQVWTLLTLELKRAKNLIWGSTVLWKFLIQAVHLQVNKYFSAVIMDRWWYSPAMKKKIVSLCWKKNSFIHITGAKLILANLPRLIINCQSLSNAQYFAETNWSFYMEAVNTRLLWPCYFIESQKQRLIFVLYWKKGLRETIVPP